HSPAAPQMSPPSLHDALPIYVFQRRQIFEQLEVLECARDATFDARVPARRGDVLALEDDGARIGLDEPGDDVEDRCLARAVGARSEEHTSELQSRENLVCRLL